MNLLNKIIINPIIPIWLMTIICILMIAFSVRKNVLVCIRRVLIIVLLFVINLRLMLPGDPVEIKKQEMNSYCIFAMDNTISMLALDGRDGKNRLDTAINDSAAIIDTLPGARFSVISFDNIATALCPFTDNAEHAKNVIAGLYPPGEIYAKGSSLGIAKNEIIRVAKEAKEREGIKVYLFLISDGEHTAESNQESMKELANYIDGGAVIGYGTRQGAQMDYLDHFSGEQTTLEYFSDITWQSEIAISKMDEENLKKVAKEIGIEYVNMDNLSQIDSVVSKIKNQSEVITTSQSLQILEQAEDIYYFFVFPLICLLIWEAAYIVLKK